MSIFLIVLFIVILAGIGLILYAIYTMANEGAQTNTSSYLEVDNTIKALDASVSEADLAMEELDKLAKSVFEEFDGKYQELLFLYSLIDEKKREAVKNPEGGDVKTDIVVDDGYRPENPKMSQIYVLKEQGLGVSEIAKSLNMGQGEVKLILELGKVR